MASSDYEPKGTTELLESGEGEDVDYKETAVGVSIDDICAFANMRDGGTILVGVREQKKPDGSQCGQPIGCPVDDSTLLMLTNKAQNCHPPIQIVHSIETRNEISFLRIDIPPSSTRPHCTAKGTYLGRSGPRNVALLPPALLGIFLESEAGMFQARFTEATTHVTESIAETAEAVQKMQEQIGDRIEDISTELGWSDSKFDDTGDKIDRIEALLREVLRRETEVGSRLREIAKATSSKDPVREKALEQAKEAMKTAILENEEVLRGASTGDKFELKTSGSVAAELVGDDLQAIFEEVLSETLFRRDGGQSTKRENPPQ